MSNPKFNWLGKRVLITGGASGIGKITGRLLLEKGAELIIWDINPDSLENLKTEYGSSAKIHLYQTDVSDAKQINGNANKVLSEIGPVDVLINNAGIVVGKFFHEHTRQDILRTMSINAEAPMLVTHAFLPDMMARNAGHICNIASLAGLISNPRMSVYAASKWSVTGWSDSLRLEMKQLKKNISVTTVMPYYISTGMFEGVNSKLLPILRPEDVAHKVLKAIEKNKTLKGIPLSFRTIRLLQGLLNVKGFDWLVGEKVGIYATMDKFKGRKS